MKRKAYNSHFCHMYYMTHLSETAIFEEPRPTILTRDRALRTRLIILLRSKMGLKEIAEVLGVTEWTVSVSLRRLLWEMAYYLPKEEPHEG